MTEQYPVDLKIVATVTDPAGEVIETIEIPLNRPAPMHAIGIELDRRGYDPLAQNAETRAWYTTTRGARRT